MEQAGERKRKTETKGERESLFVTVQVPVTEREEKRDKGQREERGKERGRKVSHYTVVLTSAGPLALHVSLMLVNILEQ